MRLDISDHFPIIIKGFENDSLHWKKVFTENDVSKAAPKECVFLIFSDDCLCITQQNECNGNIVFDDEDKNILTEQMIKLLHGELLVDCDCSDMKNYLLPECFFYTIQADPNDVADSLKKLPISQPSTQKVFIFINGSIGIFNKLESIIDDIKSYLGADDIAFAFDGNQFGTDKSIRVNLWITV